MKSTRRIQSRNRIKRIDQIRKRFEMWRKSHKPRTRIPDRVWESAVDVARQCGLNKTAKVLHLEYAALKKRLDTPCTHQSRIPEFIEMNPVAEGTRHECTIEFENRSGGTMRIHIKGMGSPDLTALSSTFWKGKR